jgi:hypothetical protein
MLQGQALDIKFALLDPNWDFRATTRGPGETIRRRDGLSDSFFGASGAAPVGFDADSSRFAPASRFCRACVSPRQHVVRPRALLDFLRCRESF